MATKVKGEAIKEGSIPLSALATEVKDKIENAGGGANWNAQQGEAGYIENKPFDKYIQNFHVTGNFTSHESLVPFYYGNVGEKYPKLYLKATQEDGYVLFETVLNAIDTYTYEVYEYDGIEFSINTGAGGEEIFLAIDDKFGYMSSTYGDIDIEFYTISKYLDDVYLPNTVLKTTPQTLSDADKNQALANLGIDPVVWKYIMNPINVVSDEILIIPDELKFDSGGGEYRLKYPIAAMYTFNGILPIDINASQLKFKLADDSLITVSVGEGHWEY